MKTKREPVKPSDNWTCVNCKADFDSNEEMKKHLAEKHQITEFKGSKKMTLHLDSSDHYLSTWEVQIGDVTAYLTSVRPRRGFDGRYLNPK